MAHLRNNRFFNILDSCNFKPRIISVLYRSLSIINLDFPYLHIHGPFSLWKLIRDSFFILVFNFRYLSYNDAILRLKVPYKNRYVNRIRVMIGFELGKEIERYVFLI